MIRDRVRLAHQAQAVLWSSVMLAISCAQSHQTRDSSEGSTSREPIRSPSTPQRSCPTLPTSEELFKRLKRLEHLCSARARGQVMSAAQRVQSPPRQERDPEWEVETLALEVTEKGGVGWTIYRPLSPRLTRLPQRSELTNACAASLELVTRGDQVWAIERWVIASPMRGDSVIFDLSHPLYATSSLRLWVDERLSAPERWRWELSGVCPSLLPTTASTPSTPPIYQPNHRTSLLACGRGAGPDRRSALIWHHRVE